MASTFEGTVSSIGGTNFAVAAGRALNELFRGPDRDKRIAQKFCISPRMAKYLRSGKRWTVERLTLASAVLGEDFDRLLIPSVRVEPLEDRALSVCLARLEREIEDFRKYLKIEKGWGK